MVERMKREGNAKVVSLYIRAMERAGRERIGARIRRARRESDLTQAELAGFLGVTTRSVQNYESGAIVPYRHLGRIELVTRKRPGWLLREDGDGGALDDTIVDLRQTMEQHQALLSDHLRVLQQTAERLRESRDARERRRGPPPAA